MLGEHEVIAFVATKLPDQAKAFYSRVLRLRLVSDAPFALVVDARGTMLRVSKVAELPQDEFGHLDERGRPQGSLVQGPGRKHAVIDSVLGIAG